MIWIFAFVAAIFPAMAFGAWGKYEVVKDTQVTELITKMCAKNGAEDKVPQVLDAIEIFEKCAVSLFKDEVLLEEVASAIRNNDLNGVFKRYCDRAPRMAACAHALIDRVVLCTGGVSAVDAPIAYNFIDQLFGFVCHNDGERIALFIHDGGPQCFQRNAANMHQCVAKAFHLEKYSSYSISERCKMFDQMSECLVSKVSGCSPLTPANMTLSLLMQLRQAMPCPGDQDETFRSYMSWLHARTTLGIELD